jgi:SAM-dependent methyltransferase
MSEEVRRRLAAIDTRNPSLARMHDYLMGGKDNFAVDREAAEAMLAIAPELRDIVREHHACRTRVVRFMASEGIDQFIDIATTLPSRHHTQQVARQLNPAVRTAFVDRDPVVLTHARALLSADPNVAIVPGDIMHVDELLADPELRRLIDLDRPVGVLVRAVLQYIPDSENPHKAVARLRDALPHGSLVAISHIVFDVRPEIAAPLSEVYARYFRRPRDVVRMRTDVARFFEGMEPVEPGLVYAREWRPESPFFSERPNKAWEVWGVARVVKAA